MEFIEKRMNLWQINNSRKIDNDRLSFAHLRLIDISFRHDSINYVRNRVIEYLLYAGIIESFVVHTYAFFHLFACHYEKRNVRKSRSTRHLDSRRYFARIRKERKGKIDQRSGIKTTLVPNNHILMTQWLYKWIILEHFRITEER